MVSIYDFELRVSSGELLDWNNFKGKKILLVNTASECGFTPQFEALQDLYHNTKREEFEIIGIPSNDFGAQDPGSNEEILSFCQRNFGITFTITQKELVVGPASHAIFHWLRESLNCNISWNFQKFLIDENGMSVKTLSPEQSPTSIEIIEWLEKK